MHVIVTGSLGYDYIMDFPGRFADRIMPDKIHQISLSFLVDKLSKQFGGTAGNIAYSLKLLGLDPLIMSSAGNDFSEYQKHLQAHHIKTNFISEHKNVTTGAYFVITDQDDNQIGAFHVGATKFNKSLSLFSLPLSFRQSWESHQEKDPRWSLPSSYIVGKDDKTKIFVVISPNVPESMKKYVFECRRDKLPYLYDPAFQIDNFTAKELYSGIAGAEILVGNDYELALIEKKLNVSHNELLQLIPIVITTLGNDGSVIEYNPSSPPLKLRRGRVGLLKINPAKPKNTSDPTGAGDAYRAGFLVGYLRGFDLTTCGQMGSVAAVYTVEKYGTQTHKFTREEFSQRYRQNYGTIIKL